MCMGARQIRYALGAYMYGRIWGKLWKLWKCADSSVSFPIEIRYTELEYDVYLLYTVVCCMLSNYNRIIIIYCEGIERTFHFCLSVGGICDNRIVWYPFISNFLILLRPKLMNNQSYPGENSPISFSPLSIPNRSKWEIKCIPRFLVLVYYVLCITLLATDLMFCELVEQLHQNCLDFPQNWKMREYWNFGYQFQWWSNSSFISMLFDFHIILRIHRQFVRSILSILSVFHITDCILIWKSLLRWNRFDYYYHYFHSFENFWIAFK